ncbi:MAG: hypothetical protein KAT68_01460 [Bacteroidales bacterium]|nr:hypothetical protein [Bacteroidales bacterium]
MYLLKTKGTSKIPDYIQIRDDDFILIDHFNANTINKNLKKWIKAEDLENIIKTITELPFGELTKIRI